MPSILPQLALDETLDITHIIPSPMLCRWISHLFATALSMHLIIRPRGYYGDSEKECTCPMTLVSRYQKHISRPLLDRIDIHVEVPRVDYDKLSDVRLGESSKVVCVRVEAAREHQRTRFARTVLLCNADMGPAETCEFCKVDEASRNLLKAAMQQLHLRARAYHRVLKLSRTIAYLTGSEQIQTAHIAEAGYFGDLASDADSIAIVMPSTTTGRWWHSHRYRPCQLARQHSHEISDAQGWKLGVIDEFAVADTIQDRLAIWVVNVPSRSLTT
jgi:hypothetical protein